MGKRGHWGSRGVKIGYTSATKAGMVAERMQEEFQAPFTVYRCRYCLRFHVGRKRKRTYVDYDPALDLELGERTYSHLRAQNRPGPGALAALKKYKSTLRRLRDKECA